MKRFSGAYNELLKVLSLTAFRRKDQNTWLGFLWTLISPALLMGVLYFLFRDRLGDRSSSYMIYLLSGIIAWSFFASASSTAMISLAAQRNLTRNFSFPKEIIPLSCIGGILIEYLLKILILLALMCFLHVSFSASLLILIPAILVQTLFVAGVGLCLAFFFVYARDLDHVWRVFLQAGFFCTPVFYRLKTVSPEFRAILHWNPMTHMLLILRVPLLEGQWPPFFSIVYCLAWSTGLFFVGLWLFKKYEFDVAEKA